MLQRLDLKMMGFKNVLKTEAYKDFEHSVLDKDCELPEHSFKIRFAYRSKYLFELIKDEDIIKLICLNYEGAKEKKFYVIPWNDENVYEFTIDETVAKDYVDLMYEPYEIETILPPKNPYAISEGNIYIVDQEKTMAIVADRYYDVLYYFSQKPIKNIENRLIEYIEA
jgi:hypothetical protein